MIWPWVLLALLGLLASGFYSGAETGVYCLHRIRLRLQAERGVPAARRLTRLLNDERGLIAVTLAGTNLSNYLTTVCVAYALVNLLDISPGQTELLTTAIVTPIVFVFGEVLPKNIFQRDADRLMVRGSRLLWISNGVFRATGVIRLLRFISDRLIAVTARRRTADESSIDPRRQMSSLLREGVAEGLLTPEQSGIIDRVMALASVQIGAVMIPRDRMVAVPVDATREQFIEQVRTRSYSRLPVYRGDTASIVGVVNVHEALSSQADWGLQRLLHEPAVLRPDQSVPSALLHMQRARRAMAVVTDRSGTCVGIVTLKDLVEEIVGELSAW